MIGHGQTFGSTIRAARLGYHSMADVGFVRIWPGGPPHRIDVAPFAGVPVARGKRGGEDEHIVWWEGDRQLIEEVIRRHIQWPVMEARTIYLDDLGNLVGETDHG